MRGGRSLLILLVLAVGLGAYAYFVESKRDPAATEKKERLFTIEAGAIDEVEVKVPTGTTTTLKKTGDAWTIAAPVSAPADSTTVSGITSALAAIDIDRVVDDNPASMAQFGLEVPVATISFKAGGQTHRLDIGNKTPTGSGLYARADDQKRLLLIPAFHEETFKRSTFDLRDKRVLAFERDRVDSLSLAGRGAVAIDLTQKDGDWRMTTPIAARADFSPVDGLVGRVAQAQMTSVVSEGSPLTPAELKTYGLDAPQVVVTVGVVSTRATLALGGKKDDGAIYARDLSRPLVFTVESSLLTDLTKKPEDLRVKTVFEFQSFTAVGLDLVHGATAVSYGKSKPAGNDPAASEVWAQTKPAAKDVNQTAMTDLLNTVSSLRIERFVERAPASGDDLVVTARAGDAAAPVEEKVTLRKAGGTAYAILANEPGAGVIPTADFDKAVSQLQVLTSAK